MASFEPQSLIKSAWKIIPFFQSRDIRASVQLYTTELGFQIGSEQAGFASLFAGPKAASNIYFLLKRNNKDFHPASAMIALGAEQLESLYGGLKQRQENRKQEKSDLKDNQVISIVEPIADKEWGFRQFTIADMDGNRVTFFRFLEGSNGEEYWDKQ